jgi:hypothetical protein
MMTAQEIERLQQVETELAHIKGVLRKLGYVFPEDDDDPLTWEEVIHDAAVHGNVEKLNRWVALGRPIPKELPPL